MSVKKEKIETCGCCISLISPTPALINNRPGLSSLVYRVGTFGQFKQGMMNGISGQEKLKKLTIRQDDDFSIALLDAWAVTADVLAFYQERIANEGFLRTATERLSVLQLARLIGYELNPGVAANAYLAFTIEDVFSAGTPNPVSAGSSGSGEIFQSASGEENQVTVDIGTQVQSMPGQDEFPQTFETVEKITARKEWNDIKPRLTNCHPLKNDTNLLYIDGVTSDLNAGSVLLFEATDTSLFKFFQVVNATSRPQKNYTEIRLEHLADVSFKSPPNTNLKTGSTTIIVPSPLTQSYQSMTQPLASTFLEAEAKAKKFEVTTIFDNLRATKQPPPWVMTFRLSAAIFGHNAPEWDALPNTQRYGEYGYDGNKNWVFIEGPYNGKKDQWVHTAKIYEVSGENVFIYLDNKYPKIVEGSWVLLKNDTASHLYQVLNTCEVTSSGFTLTAKVTRLRLNLSASNAGNLDVFNIRPTTVYAQIEIIDLAAISIDDVVKNKDIKLNDWIDGLQKDQNVIVSGESAISRGNSIGELATIDEVYHDLSSSGCTQIRLKNSLSNSYVRNTVSINANVALATHGETVTEVLGSGDASQVFQGFYLRQPPLTYVSSSSATGVESTLEVRVNDLLWKEVSSFYGRGANEQIYITRRENDGKTRVQFGDGINSCRLPSGQENVTATYRKGIGLEGLVNSKQLSLLMSRPFGVKGVNNTLPSSGAADPEKLEEARSNAPLTVLTLDRVVSLRDFEDFTRAFAGIDKARADWLWDKETKLVFLTVAGAKRKAVAETDTLYKNLLKAIEDSGNGRQPFRIESYVARSFFIKAKIKIDGQYIKEKVKKQVRDTLNQAYSFPSRKLAQPVTKSEVLAVIQGVKGVVAVDLDELYLAGENPLANAYLPARTGRWDKVIAGPTPAELLTLHSNGITLLEMTS